MWNHFGETLPLLFWKINLHMRCMLPKEIKDLFTRSANDIVNLIYLVQFIVAWEEGTERENLVHYASHSPNVHFITVIAVC